MYTERKSFSASPGVWGLPRPEVSEDGHLGYTPAISLSREVLGSPVT